MDTTIIYVTAQFCISLVQFYAKKKKEREEQWAHT